MKSSLKVVAAPANSLGQEIVKDLYVLAKKAVGDRIKSWQVTACARKLANQVHKIRMVKTLWQVDKAVNLEQFYCEPHLILAKERTVINSIEDLGNHKKVLITGIAGQGKSIFLRHICSNAFLIGKSLPVFIELRRVLPAESLLSHIKGFLEVIGLKELDDDLLRVLLASGKIVLFLDGFDEVPEDLKAKMINEIEKLALAHDELRIIVTSRPESGLEVSPQFEIVPLSPLAGDEYRDVICKLSDDSAFAKNLVKQIEAHKTQLRELLNTPLLVMLLVISYKSFQELPVQLSEFYDSIFQVLLQRHDGAKPGFKRPRRCTLNDHQYRSVFECLCYKAKRKRLSIFAYDELCGYAKAALEVNNLKEEPSKYLEDIIKVTCLILREGEECRFIHKSVQEYYAAAFIRNCPEPVAKHFYQSVVSADFLLGWQQELSFLSEIDRYRHNKYFYLPHLCRILGCSEQSVPPKAPQADVARARSLFGPVTLGIVSRANNAFACESMTYSDRDCFIPFKYRWDLIRMDMGVVMSAVLAKLIPAKKGPSNSGDGQAYYVHIQSILDAGILTHELCDLTQKILDEIYPQAVEVAAKIQAEEAINIEDALPALDDSGDEE